MGYVKFFSRDRKNISQRVATANAANLANPETELDEISHDSQISQSEAGKKENPDLKKYIDELEQFSFGSAGELPPRPPFTDPPERDKAWAAWWSAIDRRNRKFKVGRWEPLVSPLKSTAIANRPNDEPDSVPPVPAIHSSPAPPEQLSLTDLSENESPTDNGQPPQSDCLANKGPRRGTPVVA
jgi:hypothetical protein